MGLLGDAHGLEGWLGESMVDTSNFLGLGVERGGASMSSPKPRKWEFSLDFCPAGETEVKACTCELGESQAKGPISQLCQGRKLLGANIICQAAPGHQILWWGLYQEGIVRGVTDTPKRISRSDFKEGRMCRKRWGWGQGSQGKVLRPSCDLPAPKPGGAQEGKVLPGYSKSRHHAKGPLTPLQELRPRRDSHCESYDQAWRDLG